MRRSQTESLQGSYHSRDRFRFIDILHMENCDQRGFLRLRYIIYDSWIGSFPCGAIGGNLKNEGCAASDGRCTAQQKRFQTDFNREYPSQDKRMLQINFEWMQRPCFNGQCPPYLFRDRHVTGPALHLVVGWIDVRLNVQSIG